MMLSAGLLIAAISLPSRRDHDRSISLRSAVEVETPLLLTVTADLNEPRYPSLPAHLAALKAPIAIISPHEFISASDESNEEMTLLEMHTPRPLPRYVTAPNSKDSAYRRIGDIVSGGATSRKARLLEGAPEELAASLVDFLKTRGFV